MSTELEQSDELLVGFIDESLDALRELSVQLSEYRQDPSVADPINCVFRAIHSIKGNAGFFGLTAIKKFSHSLENTLDDIRNGRLSLTEDLERAFVDGFDFLDEMLQRVLEGAVDEELGPREAELLERVAKLAAECDSGSSEEERLLADALALAEEIHKSGYQQSAEWVRRIKLLVPSAETEADAPDEESGVAEQKIGPAHFIGVKITIDQKDATPWLDDLLKIFPAVENKEYNDEIGQAFLDAAEDFAAWAEPAGHTSLAAALISARTDLKMIIDSPFDIDQNLLSIVWDHIHPELMPHLPAEVKAVAEPEPAKQESEPSAKAKESADKPPAAKKATTKARFLRVKEECVDGFMDDVSSLFITAERLKDVHNRMSLGKDLPMLVEELRQINSTFVSQTNALQQSVVVLRKVPARGLFSKFPQVARSLASKLGKKLNVHLLGEENEIDKSLVEDLDAPLTHMVRNVCDHAIDMPEERLARGVSEDGNMTLKCELTRSHVIITIQDDGRGIDPVRVRNKAVEKGVITQAQAEQISDQDAIDLIFHPGFSMAEKISDVSGRGVGMDVVRTKLREHDGDVRVESELGVGTNFYLEIPIRQAVLVVDGLLLEHNGLDYVVAFESIREILELDKSDLKTVQGTYVAQVRGKPYAAISLGQLLDGETREVGDGETTEGVLIGSKEGMMCLLVDKILGQRKVVVNSLSEILPGTDKLSGVAQLGAGRLALVLSVPDLIKSVRPELVETGGV